MNVGEPLLAFALEQPHPESVPGGFAQPKLPDVGDVHEPVGRLCVRANVNALAIAQEQRRAYGTGGQQELVFASVRVWPVLVVFVLLFQHQAAGAFEELPAAVGKRARLPSGLAQHSQRQRVPVDVLEAAILHVIQHSIRIDLWELVRQKRAGIVTAERQQVEQQCVLAIVFLDPDAIRSSPPVGLPARDDERRMVHRREPAQHRVHRAARHRRCDLIEPVDDDPLAFRHQGSGVGAPHEGSRPHTGHSRALTQSLCEYALSHAGIAENHHRLPETRDVVLRDLVAPSLAIPIGQRPVDADDHRPFRANRLAAFRV